MSKSKKLDKKTWVKATLLVLVIGVFWNLLQILNGDPIELEVFFPGIPLVIYLLFPSSFDK